MALEVTQDKIKELFSKEEIEKRVSELANKISQDYKDSKDLIVVGVLKGSVIFTSDLIRKLDVPCQLEFIRLSSYEGSKSSGKVRIYDLSLPDVKDKDIIIAEDIVDSGRTAQFLLNFFKSQGEVRSVKLATLLDKPSKRASGLEDVKADYTCFTIDDIFILGYGLDYDQDYRDLPYLGYIDGLN